MDDHEILQHLLGLESEAAALVTDAQAEADRRVAEGEKQNRALHEETYTREVEALEADYMQNLASIKENYQKQLDEYREGLKKAVLDTAAFSSLAEDLLIKNVSRGKVQGDV